MNVYIRKIILTSYISDVYVVLGVYRFITIMMCMLNNQKHRIASD